MLAGLRRDNENEALAILTLFDEIRGFGPVKEAAARTVTARIGEAMAAFERPGEKPRLPDAA